MPKIVILLKIEKKIFQKNRNLAQKLRCFFEYDY